MLDVVQTIVAAPHLQTTNSNTRWQKIFERRQSFVRRGKRGKFIVSKKIQGPNTLKIFLVSIYSTLEFEHSDWMKNII